MTETKTSASSPTKKKETGNVVPMLMNFHAAFQRLASGAKIRRGEWTDKSEYCLLKDNFVMIRRPDGSFYRWNISDADLFAMDWSILP